MNKLIVLSQVSCNPCTMVKNFLNDQNVSYEVVDVNETPEVAAEYGIMSTPVSILLDGEGKELQRVSGFNPPQLEELISKL